MDQCTNNDPDPLPDGVIPLNHSFGTTDANNPYDANQTQSMRDPYEKPSFTQRLVGEDIARFDRARDLVRLENGESKLMRREASLVSNLVYTAARLRGFSEKDAHHLADAVGALMSLQANDQTMRAGRKYTIDTIGPPGIPGRDLRAKSSKQPNQSSAKWQKAMEYGKQHRPIPELKPVGRPTFDKLLWNYLFGTSL